MKNVHKEPALFLSLEAAAKAIALAGIPVPERAKVRAYTMRSRGEVLGYQVKIGGKPILESQLNQR